jgi:signal transduction histidine kinase
VTSLRPRGRPRIRRRLALIAAVATGTVMLAFCVPLAFFVRTVAYDRAIDAAELQARSLAAELAGAADQVTISRITRQANGAAVSRATVYLAGGRATTGHPVSGIAGPAHAAVPLEVKSGHPTTTAGVSGSRNVWEPVHRSRAVAVVVHVLPGELTKGVFRTWAILFGGGALLVLFAVGLADRLGRSIVRPLQALEDVTHRLRDGDLEQRHEPAGPYEVAEVGEAVNELADRISSLIASTRVAAADLGHRLRTPLTALRLDVEAITDGSERARVAAGLETVEAAVSRLIQETRQEPRQASRSADLSQAIRDRMAFWSVLAKSQHRPVDVRAPSRRVDVSVSRDELDAAIDALLSNVFAHTPEGTAFSVHLRPSPGTSSTWSLVVEDQGGRADAEPVTVNGRPSGTGLGLDIVRRTAVLGGGSAEIGRGANGGYRIEIRLPVRTADA